MPDVVVIGAGVVGAACAFYAARAGLTVAVFDRGGVAAGTTGAGEGNILVSDKEPGPELALALRSNQLWRELAAEIGPMELEVKGGLTVASTPDGHQALLTLAAAQRTAGVTAATVPPDRLAGLEPHLAPGLAGAVHYPQDLQVQPMLATARLLAAARTARPGGGVSVHLGAPVVGLIRGRHRRITGVLTPAGPVPAGAVVNAAGVGAAAVAALAELDLPVLPRRGFILVTQPLPPVVRHKVYAAEYVADVASDRADLQTSAVVESTASGTVLIGASRERVGLDRRFSLPVLRRLAAAAVALFPVLAGAQLIRAYRGFRPYCPDHLPIIGADPRAPGLYHACGHEGAGIGLAPGTGELIAAALTGALPPAAGPTGPPAALVPGGVDAAAFRPERFA